MTVAVLFDLEDTLVETPWADPQHVLEFRRETRRRLIELGMPPNVLENVERATIMRNKASEYVRKNFAKTDAQRFKQEMEKFLSRYELDSAERSHLFPETIQKLKTLREHGMKIGLVTNTSAKAVATVFQNHGLKNYFDAVVTRENVKKLKPDPEGILLATKKLGAKNCFMVGDLVLDVLAAKGAKAKAIMVRRDSKQPDPQNLLKSLPAELLEQAKRFLEDEEDFQVDYVVQSLSEVPTIVQREKQWLR
jgi:HAD superfamily hydrolase (TIGR01549 family)